MNNSYAAETLAVIRTSTVLFFLLSGCGITDAKKQSSSDLSTPTVSSTSPAASESGVYINTTISVLFGESVNKSTVSSTTFLLKDLSGNQVSGSVTCNGTSATFTPAAYLLPSASYTATITTGIADQNGNHLTADYTWSFTTGSKTDFTAPEILSTAPAESETNTALYGSVTVSFSEAMDPSTISDSTFYLLDFADTPVSAVISYGSTAATLKPSERLRRSAYYTACVTNEVADLAGNKLQSDHCWTFSTALNSGSFQSAVAIPTGSWPEAVAIGDVNGDGKNDVVLVTSYYFDPDHDYKLFVFLQDDAGNLATAATYTTTGTYTTRPTSVAIGDIDNNGENEVIVANTGQNIEVFSADGAGGLVSSVLYTTANSNKIKIADLNHDGRLDVVGIGWGTDTMDVYLQNAGGTLDPAVTYSVTHGGYDDLEVGDVNNDGLADVIVMSGQSLLPNVGVLIQKSDGTFNAPVYYSVGQDILTSGVGLGDINGDLLNDIVVSYGGNSPSAYIGTFDQNGSGSLDPVASLSAYDCPDAVEVADVTADGRKDVLVLHGGWDALGVYIQGTGGNLLSEELYPIPYASHYNPHGLAVGDINNDGLNDVVIADYNSGLVILYHQ